MAIRRERAGALAAAGAIHVGLIYLLATGLGVDVPAKLQQAMQVIDLAPPPPIADPPPPPPQPHSKRNEGAASAPNIQSRATEVFAPRPPLPQPPPPLPASPTPNTGAQSTTGSAPVAGPGTGSGGAGDGDGGGGDGDGDGDEGETPPREIRTELRFRDYPGDIADRLPGHRLELRFRVELDGHISDCRVVRSSGDREIDAATCDLAERGFRLHPARDRDGRPIGSWMVKANSWKRRDEGRDGD